jgi:uncharacterized protein (TIGR02145 family)
MRTKILVLSVALVLSANLHAQVTIGELVEPTAGAILDLNKAIKGGLTLSTVDLDNFYTIPNGFPGITSQADVTTSVKTGFIGALVYNTGVKNPPAGIYVWNGTNWAPIKENCAPLTPGNLTLAGLPFAKPNDNLTFSVSTNTSAICSGGETYSWSVTPATNTVQTPSAAKTSITFTATGTYKVKVAVTNRYSDLPALKEMEVIVTAGGGPTPAMLNGNYGIVGETCLDVMKPNAGQDPAVYADRKAGFPGGNYEKTYKFIHTDAYSDLSLDYVDPANLVEAITVYPPASSSADGTAVDAYYEKEFKIRFRPNIQDLVPANGDSLTVQLIASYKPNGSTEETKLAYLEIRVEDGTCVCPAKISATEWKNFMCHNLGGEDILSSSQLITRAHHGDWYRFGAAVASLGNIADNDGYIDPTDWNSKPIFSTNGSWPNTSIDANGIGNPCPAGWQLPTIAEFEVALANNALARSGTWSDSNTDKTNFSSLLKVGDHLILPTAGCRYSINGLLGDRGFIGSYWSSSSANSSDGRYLYISSTRLPTGSENKAYGFSVRCVSAE